jgi:Tol biopolymer transport system component
VFRVPSSGGTAQQVTFDPSNKTHPAYAPDGTRIAFTVWQYEAQFWLLE